MSCTTFSLKRGEGKTFRLSIKVEGELINASGATFKAGVKINIDNLAYIIEKNDVDFDKTDIALGYVYFTLTVADTNITERTYILQVRTIMTANINVDKTVIYRLKIEKSIIP